MTTLTTAEMDQAQSILDGNASFNGKTGREGFYEYLESKGNSYSRLAREVTTNKGWQGELANKFTENAAEDNNVDLSYGSPAWVDLNEKLAQRHLDAFRANGGSEPTRIQIQQYHNEEYLNANVDADDWFPNRMLNNSSDPDGTWADWLDNTGGLDLLEDLRDIIVATGNDDFEANFNDAIAELPLGTYLKMVREAFPEAIDPMSPASDLAVPVFVTAILAKQLAGVFTSSPLVFDLDSDGIELNSLTGADAVYWDIDEDGFAEASGWVSADDGLLAIDLNGDGIINDNSELFGSMTQDGFSALAEYDFNDDGVINADDAVWSDLLVWQDTSQDGFSQSTELNSLDHYNITSIDLNAAEVSLTNAGNDITHTSTFTMNGSTHSIVDVWFAYDNVNSVSNQDYTLDIRALFLPNQRGYGTLPTMHIALSLDNDDADPNSLMSLVNDFAGQSFADIFDGSSDPLSAVRDIMFRWAGVDGVAADSRGPNIDARELEFLEEFVGYDILQRGWNPNPGSFAAQEFQEAFDIALNNIYGRLLGQTNASDLYTGDVSYNIATDSIEGITGLDTTAISTLGSEASSEANKEIFWQNVVRFIENSYGVSNLSTGDYNALDAAIITSDSSLSLNSIVTSLGYSASSTTTTTGDSGDNVITGGLGQDEIEGLGGNDTLSGGSDADRLEGGAGNDTLNGNAGSDYLLGGAGDDTYVFNSGEIFDAISERNAGGNDTIRFGAGITLADLTFTRVSEEDLEITIAPSAGGGSILIEDHFNNGLNSVVETIEFSDSSTFALDSLNWTIYGTEGNDNISGVDEGGSQNDTIYADGGIDIVDGGAGDDVIYGGAGNDKLYGQDGHDTLHGEDGNDVIYAYHGNDTIYTGTGNDTVYTGTGDDTVHYEGGDLYIKENVGGGAGGSDKIVLMAGIVLADLSFTKISDDLIITIQDQGTITIGDHYYLSNNNFEAIEFADASTLDLSTITLSITGTSGNDSLYGADNINDDIFGLEGDDFINSGSGNDRIFGGDGNDTIRAEEGDNYIEAGAGDDIIRNDGGNSFISTGTGNDHVYTGSGGDTYLYTAGNDVYEEGQYAYGEGGFDVITFMPGIAFDDLTFTKNGDHLNITVASLGTIEAHDYFASENNEIEELRFDDGSSFDLSNLVITTTGTSGNDILYGDDDLQDELLGLDGDDELYGYEGNDILNGGAGNDYLDGEWGNDTFIFGSGNDIALSKNGDNTFIYSSGNDQIYQFGYGTDTVQFGAGITLSDLALDKNGDDVVITVGTDGTLTLIDNFRSPTFAMEVFSFADGSSVNTSDLHFVTTGTSGNNRLYGENNWNDHMLGLEGNDDLRGYSGNDILDGGTGDDELEADGGDDILIGGAGNDLLEGGSGADSFTFLSGDVGNGFDYIVDFDTSEGDVLDLSDILSGAYDEMTDLITDFIQITDNGTHSTLSVDADGGADNFVQIAQINFNTGLTDEAALESSGTLIA